MAHCPAPNAQEITFCILLTKSCNLRSWVYFIPLFKNHLQVFGHAGKDGLWMKGQFLIRAVYISNVSTHLNLTNTILKPSRCVIPQMGTATVLTFMLAFPIWESS